MGHIAGWRRVWPGVAGFLAAVVATVGAVPSPDPLDALLARARTSWATFETALGSVVADEDYRQEARWPAATDGSGVVQLLQSDLFLFRVTGSNEWVTLRQVRLVDGEAAVDDAPSIRDTLADGSQPLAARIGRLVRASARYNLGDIERTINTPTFAPIVLRPVHATRVRFAAVGEEVVDGRNVRVVRFDETARPTIVRGRGERHLPMRGRLWLDAATGQVLRSALTFADRRSALTAAIDVDYAHDAGLDLIVPQVMRERYERRGHVVTTEARYQNYRRFTTSVRVIGR